MTVGSPVLCDALGLFIPVFFIQDQLERFFFMGRSEGRETLREELLRIFCVRMAQLAPASAGPAEVRLQDGPTDDQTATLVEIRSTDNPGLFFELVNALNLCGFRIRQAHIDAADGMIHDELHVTETDRHVPLTQARRDEIGTAITLIQQFTLWLPSNADPYHALLRFRQLMRKLLQDSAGSSSTAALTSPDVLRKIARVLGLSRHLWEDALLLHHSDVLPLLTLPNRLEAAVTSNELSDRLNRLLEITPVIDQPKILNRFKDHHLFRTELRHVLGHSREFGRFSSEVTELAEVVLRAAAFIAEQELRSDPSIDAPPDNSWALAGLGKFGGTEMGFASDIELLLIFDSQDSTPPSQSVDQSRGLAVWFEKLLTRITGLVTSKRDGIFEIDLRMRPWGKAGSPAVSFQHCEAYYSETGGAWPFERQALVKLRCVAGDATFSRRIHQLRDDIIYGVRPFAFDAMRALREQQIRQFVRPGTTHAKLSEGGLVDCEYSVQALQLTFGSRHPALRTENTLKALHAAKSLNLITSQQHQAVEAACVFLRQLIDCLRMVRGNAKDLTVPDSGTVDHGQLAQRLRHVYGDQVLLEDLTERLTVIREFAEFVRAVCKDDNQG